MVSMLCGLLRPDKGQILVDGGDVGKDTAPAERKLGLVPQELALFQDLSSGENLKTLAHCTNLRARHLPQRSPQPWNWSDWTTGQPRPRQNEDLLRGHETAVEHRRSAPP
jgi:ABC-type Fe3+/spermidine/putrescine transport system ATPase subunit